MSTIDLRARRRRRGARRQAAATAQAPAAPPTRRRLVTFEHHECGRWLALEVFLRGHRAGPPFALRHERGTVELTVGQLEHLVLVAGPAALARYRAQETALLAGGLDEEPAPAPRAQRSPLGVAAHVGAPCGADAPTPAAPSRQAAAVSAPARGWSG